MTHSPLTDQIRLTPKQKGTRSGTKIGFIQLHHQASTNDDATINMMVSGSRQVSANYTVSNEGRATLVVDENERAWTSGSPIDDKAAITFEIENESTNGWTISAKAFEKVAQMVAEISGRYGIPLDRTHVYGHRELYQRYRRSYATACPGGLDLDGVVRRAAEIRGGAAPASPSAPAPAIPGVPAPGFPLPGGWYFGPKSGPKESVSGYFSYRDNLRQWQQRMHDRGWDIGVDGLYGPNTASVARHFQAEKGLGIDGLIGPATWAAAWTAPIT